MPRLSRWIPACLAASLLASPTVASAQEFTIATGAKDGNYYSVGGALCRLVNERAPARCATAVSKGSVDNLHALRLGDAQFAIVQSDVQKAAREGSEVIADTPDETLRSVFSIYPEMLAVVVRADSPVETFEDIAERAVDAARLGSGTRWTFDTVLAAAGIDPTTMTLVEGDGATALCEGAIDAVVAMTGHPSAYLNRLGDTCPTRMVPVGGETIAALVAANPAYRAMTVPAEFYASLDEDLSTIGVFATLVTSSKVPDASVTAILEAVFADYGAFRRQHLALGAPTPAGEGLTAPLHDAARRFFREKGLMQ